MFEINSLMLVLSTNKNEFSDKCQILTSSKGSSILYV